MDCKRVEEGVVVVLGDKKKALLNFLVRDVDMNREIRRTEEKSTADNTLYFHTHTQRSGFSPILLTQHFLCILDFASRISE